MGRQAKKTASQKKAELATRRRRESQLLQEAAANADDSSEATAPPVRPPPVVLNGRKVGKVRRGRKGSFSKEESSWTWTIFFKWVFVAFVALLVYTTVDRKDIHNSLISVTDKLPLCVKNWFESFHAPTPKKEDDKVIKTNAPHDWLRGPDPTKKLHSLDQIKYVTNGPLFLVLIGHVFDVTGAEYYQPGSGYHAFIGQDASRSFVTGNFTDEGVTDDLEGLQATDYIGLENWLKFYLDHESYKFVGYLEGKYFDSHGYETAAMKKVKALIGWAKEEVQKEGDLLQLFPSCNVDWKAESGSTLWCSAKSGGVDRDWVGFPRKFFEKPDKSPRCACVHPNYLADPRVKEYLSCPSTSLSCKLLESDK